MFNRWFLKTSIPPPHREFEMPEGQGSEKPRKFLRVEGQGWTLNWFPNFPLVPWNKSDLVVGDHDDDHNLIVQIFPPFFTCIFIKLSLVYSAVYMCKFVVIDHCDCFGQGCR